MVLFTWFTHNSALTVKSVCVYVCVIALLLFFFQNHFGTLTGGHCKCIHVTGYVVCGSDCRVDNVLMHGLPCIMYYYMQVNCLECQLGVS